MNICCEYCVLRRWRSLRRPDHSSRGVLPTLLRRSVWSRNLMNAEAMAHWGGAIIPKTNNYSLISFSFCVITSVHYSTSQIFTATSCFMEASLSSLNCFPWLSQTYLRFTVSTKSLCVPNHLPSFRERIFAKLVTWRIPLKYLFCVPWRHLSTLLKYLMNVERL